MTEKEWLDIGYDKNIIDVQAYEEITFHDVYKQWFLMKLKRIKEQSCDRIEVTFNKYYANDPIIEKYISKISTTNIIDFLTGMLYYLCNITNQSNLTSIILCIMQSYGGGTSI